MEYSLSKFLAQAGVCSRRKAVDLIKQKQVLVNDQMIDNPAHRIKETDVVKVNNKIISLKKRFLYLLMNKPKDCITTASDELGRKTVLDLLRPSIEERVYPVGRLDRNTTGVLLLTNDGDLAYTLAHPKFQVKKTYVVTCDRRIEAKDIEALEKGIRLDDEIIRIDNIEHLDSRVVEISLHSGKYRVIRRIFELLGYEVEKLDRVEFAGLTKKKLRSGQWRDLTEDEIKQLKKFGKK